MPRGYLKHKKEAGYKKSRGGGGHKSYSYPREEKERPCGWLDKLNAEVEYAFREYANEADCVDSGNAETEKYVASQREGDTIGQCTICFETRSVIKLLRKCKHPPACYDCLRRIFVTEAQKDVANFPLRCFDPTCRRPVTDQQLRIHNLVQTDEELAKHYRLTVLAKGYRNESITIHCPHCDHPRSYHQSPRGEQERIFACKNCGTNFIAFTSLSQTIKAVEEFKEDNMGINDGWGRCPSCRIIISKGSGCDHIACVCGQHFYWWDALKEEQSTLRYAVARPAENNIR